MKLERYVELENGSIIDVNHDSLIVSKYANNGCYSRIVRVGDEIEDGEHYAHGDIVRTSADIWGLAKVGWLFATHKNHVYSLSHLGGTDNCVTYSTDQWLIGTERVIAFYAPITENGKVTSYTLVWEREE